MSIADLGVRIFLMDGFSSGFYGISRALSEVGNSISRANSSLGSFDASMASISGSIGSSIERTAALDTTLAGLSTRLEEARLQTIALQDQGRIFTPNQAAQLTTLTAELDAYQVKAAAAEATIAKWQNIPFGVGSSETAKAQAELDIYNAKIAETELKIETLNDVGLANQERALSRSEAAQARLNTQMDIANTKIEKESMLQAKLNDEYDAEVAAQTRASLSLGTLIGSGIGVLAFGGAIAYAVTQAKNIDTEIANLQVSVPGATARLADMKTTLLDLANNSIFSTQQIGDGFALVGQRGYTASNIINDNMGSALTNLAEATRSDVVPAADLLSGVMQTFGAKASEASRYADILTTAFYNGIPSLDQLKGALSQVGSQANSVGWSFQDTATALDLLGQKGLPAEQAGTALRYMLASLVDPTNKVQQTLAALGNITINSTSPAFIRFSDALSRSGTAGYTAASKFDGTVKSLNAMYTAALKAGTLHTDQTFYEWAVQTGLLSNNLLDAKGNLKDLKGLLDALGGSLGKLKTPAEFNAFIGQLGGARSGKAFEDLLKNIGATDKQIKLLEQKFGVVGTAQAAAKKQTDTLGAALHELHTTFQDLSGLVGGAFMQPLANLAHGLNDLISGFVKNHQAAMPMIAAFLSIGFVLSVIVFAVSGVIASIASFGIITPIVIGVGVAIAGIAFAVNWFKSNWATVGPIVEPIIKALSLTFSDMKKDMSTLSVPGLGTIKDAFASLQSAVGELTPALSALAPVFGIIGAIVVSLFMGLISGLVAVFAHIILGFAGFVAGIINLVVGIGKIFGGLFAIIHGLTTLNGAEIQKGWNLIVEGVKQAVQGLVQAVVGAFTATFGAIWSFGQGMANGITNFMRHIFHTVDDSMKQAKIAAEMHSLQQRNKVITNFMQQDAQSVKHLEHQRDGIVNALKNCKNESERHSLEMKLKLIDNAIQTKDKAIQEMDLWRKQNVARMAQLKLEASQQAMGIKDRISGYFQDLWHNVTGFVGNMAKDFEDRFNSIKNTVMNIGPDLYNAGKNAIQMLARGISDSVGNVLNSVGMIGQTIKDHLGFHSPPKSGVLTDSDTYMPNMMRMFADDITSHAHLVQAAALGVASGISGSFSPTHLSSFSGVRHSPSSQGTQETHIHLYMDGKEFKQMVQKGPVSEMKINGFGRYLK